MKRAAVIFATFALVAITASAKPPTADQILADAKTKAAGAQKTIFVHFGASWCGPCKRLDAFLERDDIKPVFEKYFVPVKLVVQENAANKALENEGADAVLEMVKKVAGPSGLPYSAFLDAKGAFIVDSRRPTHGGSTNISYPVQSVEVDWFIQMMRKAAPKISAEDVKTIETALRTAK